MYINIYVYSCNRYTAQSAKKARDKGECATCMRRILNPEFCHYAFLSRSHSLSLSPALSLILAILPFACRFALFHSPSLIPSVRLNSTDFIAFFPPFFLNIAVNGSATYGFAMQD